MIEVQKTIHYLEMLNEINNRHYLKDASIRKFEIKARRTSGAGIGKVYFKKCSLNIGEEYEHKRAPKDNYKKTYNARLQDKSMINLYDCVSHHQFNIPYYAIIEYNGMRVNHTYLN